MFDFMMDDFSGGDTYTAPTGPIIPDAMDCMRCGVCLSQCPTYALTHDEQESPRQRIRTIEKIVVHSEAVDDTAIEHLNNCTQCRACEASCPSQMSYGELFDKAQHKLAENQQKGFYAQLAMGLIADKKQLKRAMPLVRFYHISGARWLAKNTGLLKLLKLDLADNMAKIPVSDSLQPSYPSQQPSKGKVALFTGCVSEHFDRQTIDATIQVLTQMGYQVDVPEQQVCCGALHYHNGEADTAKTLMQQNRSCFNAMEVDAIIYCASGCGSQLTEYKQMLELEEERAFTPAIYDVMEFINQHWDGSLTLKPNFKKVAVHEACSQRNVLKNQQVMYDLLAKIPGMQVSELPENHLCCGAGGSYMFTHPDNAQALSDKKWQHIQHSEANCVVTSNIGCAMHLQANQKGDVELIHPVSLLAEALG